MTIRRSLPACALLAAVAAFALISHADDKGAPAVGKAAPTFSAKTIAGAELKLPESFKGKVVLVDFWATWCPPCRREVPHLVEAHKKYNSRGLEIVSVSLDSWRKIGVEKVVEYAKKNEMSWAHVYDNAEAIAEQYGVQGIPAPFLINGDTGAVLAMGVELRGADLTATLEKHLAKAPAGSESKGGR